MPRRAAPDGSGEQLPVQPVEKPIICQPYLEPTAHWVYQTDGTAVKQDGRRPASYWYKVQRVATQQIGMFAEEQREDLPLVNALRADVKRWRQAGYRGATKTTRELLRQWADPNLPRRLFFCQLEAAETVIYLAEIRLGGKSDGFKNHQTTDQDVAALRDEDLTRLGCKMATGSGKTVVMAMLAAWTICNHAVQPSDPRFSGGALVCCPNLTVKERLQVLRPENKDNYYAAFDLVPATLRPLLPGGKVLVTNWHLFAPESEHAESGKSYPVVNKGPESDDAFARRVLGDLYDRAPLLVFNDEGHHCWRPAPLPEPGAEVAPRQAEDELREATVWISGLDRLRRAVGLRFCLDLSATPFYIAGSGYVEGRPFPWLVSDFGLVDAIESGIVKIPRLPVSDNTGRPEPKYFRLWKQINEGLAATERLPGGRPKPDVVYKKAEGALLTLAGQWVERYNYVQEASDAQVKVPPVLILVCDNTDIAAVFYEHISGEKAEDVVEAGDDEGSEDEAQGNGRRKPKKKVVYGDGDVFPEYFSNREGRRYTLRIDTKLLAEAESEEPDGSRKTAAQELRRLVATVGKRGEPGEHLRCVVSVGMLTEGWDANNVTNVLGVRAFGSQLLCEQVVGRGLRRLDYTPDKETGLLAEEYVDIYGIPFSVVPFKGRQTTTSAPEDKPIQHVRALPERKGYELRFPVVEGYAFALRRNAIKADIAKMEPLELEPNIEPTAVFVQPTVGYRVGTPGGQGPGEYAHQNRQEYYRTMHLQAIEFVVARLVVMALVGEGDGAPAGRTPKLRLAARHELFPQVLQLVKEYVRQKVRLRGCHPCELGLQKYVQLLEERLVAAIEPDDSQGEQRLLPILNRYLPIGSTAAVDFKTVRPCAASPHSHINQVVADTNSWEQAAVFRLEETCLQGLVACYARNDHLGLVIPYDYAGVGCGYEPDFLVKLAGGQMLLLEIKGYQDNKTQAKHAAARRWLDAVNNWGQLGRWDLHVCRDPQQLGQQLAYLTRPGLHQPVHL